MNADCEKCLLLQAKKMIAKNHIVDCAAQNIFTLLKSYIDEHRNNSLSTPEASCFLYRLLKKESPTNDLYKEEKEAYNNLMLNIEPEIKANIDQSENPFQTALRYALAGNIIDFGPCDSFNVFEALSVAASQIPEIDHSPILYDELKKARTVLYLGDNAGEIVLDKLFISEINHPNLYFATRGDYVINDVTTEDAEKVGMAKVARVISNGHDAPSTLLDYCSPEFKNVFEKADIVISKGQGNLEGLINNRNKKIFFLLIVKCSVIGEIINVRKKNSVAFFNQIALKMKEAEI